tara:strand:- start:112 stop:333 length:222 start_codon:yes stop_codon:yes gene_type:complete
MAYKMKYTNGKKVDTSAFPFKTQENVMDNTISNNVDAEEGKNDELINLLEQENEISKKIEDAKKSLATKTNTI